MCETHSPLSRRLASRETQLVHTPGKPFRLHPDPSGPRDSGRMSIASRREKVHISWTEKCTVRIDIIDLWRTGGGHQPSDWRARISTEKHMARLHLPWTVMAPAMSCWLMTKDGRSCMTGREPSRALSVRQGKLQELLSSATDVCAESWHLHC